MPSEYIYAYASVVSCRPATRRVYAERGIYIYSLADPEELEIELVFLIQLLYPGKRPKLSNMRFPSAVVFSLLWLGVAHAFPSIPSAIDPSQFAEADRITRDVCVIGGGAAGVYGATRIGQLGKSVVVIEKKDRLGGHTNTYIDPATGLTAEYGVEVLQDLPVVRDYFAHFDIPLATKSSPQEIAIDYRTGEEIVESTPNSDITAALDRYAAQAARYPYLNEGFDLVYPVPNDLLLAFGDFVVKHNTEAAVGTIARACLGFGNILSLPTLYVLKCYSRGVAGEFLTGTIAPENMSGLYETAQRELGADVLLESAILEMERNPGQDVVRIVVQTPSGKKLITAGKVLVAIPPKLDNLGGFDLDDGERSLFRQFKNSYFYTALLNNTGFPVDLNILNKGATTRYNLTRLPGPYGSYPRDIPGVINILYGSTDPMHAKDVKQDIVENIRRLRSVADIPTTAPEFVAFEDHSPYLLTVSTRAIVGGFYRDLNALQGYRNTYYTGATFHTHDSALIWNFTETVVQRMVQ